ncbi:MAG: HNH endonuclease signature motif containing protein [Pararobbsia sp.]
MAKVPEIVQSLEARHRKALLWFYQRRGEEISWPAPLGDGTFLVNRAKGIHKPAGLKYAVSVRESLNSAYADHAPEFHTDGTWTYRYYQEQLDPTERDSQFTNKALIACMQDGVPVGVLRQVKKNPDSRYLVLGIAQVRDWQGGYFRFESYSPTGQLHETTNVQKSGELLDLADIFNPSDVVDARKWVTASIVRRQGQGEFRAAVLAAYNGKCAVSGIDTLEALEAAHIFRYLGSETNVVRNGVLLRSDIHTLYDLGLISIDPSTMSVVLAPKLGASHYEKYAGATVYIPENISERPSPIALTMQFAWAKSTW